MKKVFLLILTVVMITALFAGCSGGEPSYAGQMTDNIISGLQNRDYTAFSRDMGDTIKSAMTEDNFNALADMLKQKIGDYQNKSFGGVSEVEQNGVKYTVVVYTAKYSNEPGDVLITVTFGGEKGAEKVAGLLFNSPKLREQ